VSEGVYTHEDIDLFIKGETFDAVFNILKGIWKPSDSIQKYYREGELYTTKLEETLLEIYPNIYRELIEKCDEKTFLEIERKQSNYCAVLMDGLSLREAFLLFRDLEESFDLDLGYSFSKLPSETETFRNAVFGKKNLSTTKDPDIKFIRDMTIGAMPDSKTLTIVTRYPDGLKHDEKKGHSIDWNPKEVYEKTRQLLFEIIQNSRHKEISVTSDHGYVDLTAGCTFPLNTLEKGMLKNQFKERFKPMENNYELEQLYNRGRIAYSNNYYMVNGRYSWAQRGKASSIRHGGISLLECMIPVIRIKKR